MIFETTSKNASIFSFERAYIEQKPIKKHFQHDFLVALLPEVNLKEEVLMADPLSDPTYSEINRKEEYWHLHELGKHYGNPEQYLVETDWINEWTEYIKGSKWPGKIKTKKLLDGQGKTKKGLNPKVDYQIFNRAQWLFLKDRYGSETPARYGELLETSHRRHASYDFSTNDGISENRKANLNKSFEIMPGSCNKDNNEAMTTSDIKLQTEEEIQVVTLMDESIEPSHPDTIVSTGENSGLQHTNSLDCNAPTLRNGKVGLENPGFFCYMNSALQCLMSITPFRDFFYQLELTSNKLVFTELISELTKSIFKLEKGAVRPSRLWKYVSLYFSPGKQHDLPEFLRFVINKLERELSENFLRRTIFNGITSSHLKCNSCNYTSITREPFIDIQLELSSTITKSIQSYTKAEKVSITCERCKSRVFATKKLSFSKAPSALIIQLKRFRSLGGAQKLDQNCKFHKNLDLSPFCEEKAEYKLVGVGVHHGSILSGHYTAFCKRGNFWYEFDDASCNKVSLKEVLAQNAYVIIYRRC
ncbi:unnamed protein product [Blepharisma stoltei]|uniref:Ubiquitinyl hydrolase 1 n=1 Tax=Blepharisma stoltei TaxID=1481888 RepID=A0AAU9JX63_9CILI|nr:unnamed protein product [Blepharisma stoltei]